MLIRSVSAGFSHLSKWHLVWMWRKIIHKKRMQKHIEEWSDAVLVCFLLCLKRKTKHYIHSISYCTIDLTVLSRWSSEQQHSRHFLEVDWYCFFWATLRCNISEYQKQISAFMQWCWKAEKAHDFMNHHRVLPVPTFMASNNLFDNWLILHPNAFMANLYESHKKL